MKPSEKTDGSHEMPRAARIGQAVSQAFENTLNSSIGTNLSTTLETHLENTRSTLEKSRISLEKTLEKNTRHHGGKAEQNKAEKKSNLLRAAFDLLSQKSIHDISISDLARQAGIAKGTFYLFFKDKYELRDALIAQESKALFDRAEAELVRNDIRDFEDGVIFIINQILTSLENNPILLRIIRRNLSWGIIQTSLQDVLDKNPAGKENQENPLLDRFCTMAEYCGYRYENPRAVFFIVVEMAGSIGYSSMIENVPLPISQMKPILFDSIRAVLRQGKPYGSQSVQ